MTIAYGIALNMGWNKPMWAGFAVAFVSLESIGQSFNKAALRMFGTLVAVVASLTFIGLFAQDRWLFMFFLAAWVGTCTYMMGGRKHPYFWHVCGFVSIIICMEAGPDSARAFNIAILRTQETGLGILVYSLVALFLWPSSGGTADVPAVSRPRVGFVLDPDRLTSSIRVMATLWLAYLALIYIADFPGGAGFLSIGGPIAMALAASPQLPVAKLIIPVTVGILFGAVIHMFIMPQLASFIGLGLLIFSATFIVCYLCAAPRQMLSRLFGLAMFISIAGISNQQTYSFISVATTSLMFVLLFLLLAITSNIPFTVRRADL
jgi:hypothetical protein